MKKRILAIIFSACIAATMLSGCENLGVGDSVYQAGDIEINKELPKEVAKGIKKLYEQLDEIIATGQGFIDDPETYTSANHILFLAEVGKIQSTLDDLEKVCDENGIDIEEYIDETANIMSKTTRAGEIVTQLSKMEYAE